MGDLVGDVGPHLAAAFLPAPAEREVLGEPRAIHRQRVEGAEEPVEVRRYIDAIPVYTGELRADQSTTGVLRLVTALNSSGRSDQATLLLRDWMQKNPTDATAAEALASLDLVARRFFDAERSLLVVLSQRPSDSNALNNLAWVYQQRSDARARAVAQKSYLLNPTPEAADTLGWILVTTGTPSLTARIMSTSV